VPRRLTTASARVGVPQSGRPRLHAQGLHQGEELGGASKFAFPIGDDKLHQVTVIQICGVTVLRSEGRGDLWQAEGPR
jgi:hypothetical protein